MRNLNQGAARIHTKSLAYSKTKQRFTGEESDLRRRLTPIYCDSIDEGFWLVSHKTGTELPFVHVDDIDDEVRVYRVAPGFLSKGDPNNRLTVHLFND